MIERGFGGCFKNLHRHSTGDRCFGKKFHPARSYFFNLCATPPPPRELDEHEGEVDPDKIFQGVVFGKFPEGIREPTGLNKDSKLNDEGE